MRKRQTMAFLAVLILIQAFILLPMYAQANIDAKTIVGTWLFEEGKGDTVRDSSGNGNDGEIKGDVVWVNEGRFGKALEFPGAEDNFVEIPHNDSLTLETFTFMAWIKFESIANYQAVIIKTANGATENYSGYLMDSSKVFWTRFTSGGAGQWGFQKFGTTGVADEEWHHLAGTYDRKVVKSYVDGVVEAEAPFTGVPDPSPGPLNIGDCPGYPYFVKGIIDDVGLFNVALSEDDIISIMDDGLDALLSVSDKGKLATTWANIKK